MALSLKELQKIKATNTHSGNTVTHLGRVTLDGLLARFAGHAQQYDEYTNKDVVSFVFYWFPDDVKKFTNLISKRPNMTQQIQKSFMDSLFKFNNDGEQVIYGQRRRPLPEIVTYDENSMYSIVVELLHAEGTDSVTGQSFSKYYTRVLNVLPTVGEDRKYLTFDPQQVSKILAGELSNESETKQLENK